MRLVIDVETTGAQRDKGAPFNLDNRMCVAGVKPLSEISRTFKIEYDEEPYGETLQELKTLVEKASTLITFNGKFDLHWLRRYGIRPNERVNIFDCQLAFFILTGQKHRYPSLDEVAAWCGVEQKLDVVKTEYWNKGLDTNDIPYQILVDYLEQDLSVTEQVARVLTVKLRESPQLKVFQVACKDLLVLEEMEWNGFRCDVEKSLRKGDELVAKLTAIDEELRRYFNCDWLNINSGDHLSAVLFGGTIQVDGTEEYLFTYKDGRTAIKTRKVKVPHTFERMFTPLAKTALKKEGVFSTSVDIFNKLLDKARGDSKKILDLLILRSKLEKRRSTYYHGLPKLISKMNWKDEIVHGNLNQCTVITGRLSSDKPNLQNQEEEVKEVFISRFPIRRK